MWIHQCHKGYDVSEEVWSGQQYQMQHADQIISHLFQISIFKTLKRKLTPVFPLPVSAACNYINQLILQK